MLQIARSGEQGLHRMSIEWEYKEEHTRVTVTGDGIGMTQVYAVRYLAASMDRLAAVQENKRHARSETERAKLGKRTYSVFGVELAVFDAFGMRNVTVRRNGRVVVKMAIKAGKGVR